MTSTFIYVQSILHSNCQRIACICINHSLIYCGTKKERAEKIDLFQLASILRQSTFINAWRMLNCFAGIMNTQLNRKINNHSRSYGFFSSLSQYLNGVFSMDCLFSLVLSPLHFGSWLSTLFHFVTCRFDVRDQNL